MKETLSAAMQVRWLWQTVLRKPDYFELRGMAVNRGSVWEKIFREIF